MAVKKKNDMKKNMIRIICIVLAAVMVLSTLVAAALSQVW